VPDGCAIAKALGSLWREGAAIDWSKYYKGEKRHRVPLPTYSFERQSYWVEVNDAQTAQASSVATTSSLEIKDAPENWFYAPNWKRADLGRAVRLQDHFAVPECWLIFVDEGNLGAELAQRLRDLGQKVSAVRRGASFSENGPNEFLMNPGDPVDYARLLEVLRQADRLPQRIVHTWNTSHANSEDSLAGFDSLIYLAQVLSTLEGDRTLKLTVLTSNIHQVLDEDLSDPGKAAALGIVHVLPKENPRIVCQSVDVDLMESHVGRLLDAILAEFSLENPDVNVAFRRGHRWVPIFDRINVVTPRTDAGLRRDGVYVVTHAFQEIGLALVERLARRDGVRIALLDRTFFPQPQDWQQWILDQGKDDFISRKIERLWGIAKQLVVTTADLADRERMLQIRKEIERNMGPIAGVFHLDKHSKTGLIQGKSGSPSGMLRTDIAEAVVLEEAFGDVEMFVFFSSNLAETGGIGQVEQAACNAVLARFAERMAECGCRALCVEWGTRGWQEAGEDSPDSSSFIYQQLEEKRQTFGMTPGECLDALERAADLNLPRVIVSTRDFNALMEQQHLFTTDYFESLMQESTVQQGTNGTAHSRPNVSTEYLAPRNDVEGLLVESWQTALGFQQIGVHDNFFELGGHSLLAVQVLKNLNETFSTKIGLKDLFEAPTISALAALISGKPIDEDDQLLESLLAEIEGLSAERVRSELDAQSSPKDHHV
jgi:acyl transferase domain-containing protein